jgi:UDP-N-acetylmuramoyl-L-alanyl-D-glutamate--2,6-diaminopimelate ligase
VLVDYAHTPDALERVLSAGRELTGGHGRVVVVFGCGGDRDRGKRSKMGRVAATGADLVVVTSDNPRSEDPASIAAMVAEGIAATDTRNVVELDRRAAIRLAIAEAEAGDVVMIAGKGHESGQTTGATTVPFDDRVVALEELESLAWT